MKRIIVIFFLTVSVFGCMSIPKFQRPYSQLYVPEENIRAIKKVLLVGPMFAGMGITDEAWLQSTTNLWQREILKKWGEYKDNDVKLFELVPSNQSHYKLLSELLTEQKLDEVPQFDTKTGQINKERATRINLAFAKLAQKEGFDAILHVDFVVVPVEVKHNIASWDGQFENIASLSAGRWITAVMGDTSPESFGGKAPGLSLSTQLINRDGTVLCEGRGGYKVLTEIKVGVFSDDRKTLSFKEAFNEKYTRQRNMALTWALMAVAAPKKSAGE